MLSKFVVPNIEGNYWFVTKSTFSAWKWKSQWEQVALIWMNLFLILYINGILWFICEYANSHALAMTKICCLLQCFWSNLFNSLTCSRVQKTHCSITSVPFSLGQKAFVHLIWLCLDIWSFVAAVLGARSHMSVFPSPAVAAFNSIEQVQEVVCGY